MQAGRSPYNAEANSPQRVYGVVFARTGYAEIMACSEEEARQIADNELKYEDVAWDDDWHCTDALPVDISGRIVYEKRR